MLVFVPSRECDVAFHFDWLMCLQFEFASGLHNRLIAVHISEYILRRQRFGGAGVYLHFDVCSIHLHAFPPIAFLYISDNIDQMCATVII